MAPHIHRGILNAGPPEPRQRAPLGSGPYSRTGPILGQAPRFSAPHSQAHGDSAPLHPSIPPELEGMLQSRPRPLSMPRKRAPRATPLGRTVAGITIALCAAAIVHAGSEFLAQLPLFQVRPDTVEFPATLAAPIAEEARLRVLAALPAGFSLMRASPAAIEEAVATDPRLADIQVALRPPNRILITANERTPEALVAAGQTIHFVDALGTILRAATPRQIAETQRPFLTGLDQRAIQPAKTVESPMAALALRFIAHVRAHHPELHARISEAHIGRDTASHLEALTIHLNDGPELRTGTQDPLLLLPDILAILKKIESEGTRLRDLAYIDLTGKDRAAVLDRPTAIAASLGIDVESIVATAPASPNAGLAPPAAPRNPSSAIPADVPAAQPAATGNSSPTRRNNSVRSLYDTPATTAANNANRNAPRP